MLLVATRYFALVQICLLLYIVGVLDPQTISRFRSQRSGSKGEVEVEVEVEVEDDDQPERAGTIDEGPKHNQTQNLLAKARILIPSILDPANTSIDRMSCPRINTARLMGSVVEAIRFLSLQRCGVSIVEGNSDDGTLEVLRLLRKELAGMGVAFWLSTSSLNPNESPDRIKYLALLRNMALEQDRKDPANPAALSPDATIVFINDILPCAEDLFELVHQRILQSADMVCALDFRYTNETDPSDAATFYDVWVARTLTGDLFFDIPPSTGGWEHSAHLPLVQRTRFRWTMKGECFQGEPQLFCKDLWSAGFGRIAVVLSVNLGRVKQEKGFVSDFVSKGKEMMLIDWQREPPEQVKCMPGFKDQTWRSWNESLTGGG
ncbi:cryptococcal mannosyltransferase 1 domain containing protein [Rhypophila decipiens]